MGGDAGLEGLQLEEGEEVGDEADQVEAHRVVQVDKVLDAQVAAVEGQRRRAEPLHQLEQAKRLYSQLSWDGSEINTAVQILCLLTFVV